MKILWNGMRSAQKGAPMRLKKRLLSLVLVLLLSFSLIPAAEAKTGTLVKNSGTRHTVAAALSAQAQAYYTGSYTYEAVSKLSTSSGDPMNSAMFSRLSTLMSSTMTKSVSYSSLTSYWPKTDANNGSSNPILFYSDELSSSYNREHVWPKSRASFKQTNGGCDLHHLRPTNANVNSTRSNYTFGNVKGVLSSYKTYAYDGKTVLWYSADADRVEVADNIKGDVARILLYVWCRWEEPNLYENDPNPTIGPGDDANNGLKVIESRETLLQWMAIDPVDTWEMSRNDQCENVQGNRNVFIDYPEYAWLLFGMTPPADYQTPSGIAMSQSPSPSVSPTATPTPMPTATPTPKPTATPTPKPTATPTPKPTATPTPKPTPTPTPAIKPNPVDLPTTGDYVLRINGGYVSEHTETVNGTECLRVDLYLSGVTADRLLSSISFKLLYDETRLAFVKEVAPSGSMSYMNSNVPGLLQFAFISANGARVDAAKPFLTLYFQLTDSADLSPILFAYGEAIKADSVSASDYSSQKRTVGAVLSPYLLSEFLYGDANCDGHVTAADASLVLRTLVGLHTLSDAGLKNAKVCGNSTLSAEDAATILRYVVRLIDRFPAEE